MLLAQITDMHILASGKLFHSPRRAFPAGAPADWSHIDTAACLARAVAELNELRPRPDAVVLTGDLTDHGSAEEYANLRRLLAPLAMPAYVIPGNHDSREGLRAAFCDAAYLPKEGFLHYAIDDFPLRIVALDTNIPGEHAGELCDERLAWLDRTLAAARAKPTVVLMHHPPFATGIEHMDRSSLKEPERFAAVIARHNQVERILCGHLHRTISRRFAGTVVGTAPATAHQLVLDLSPDAPGAFIFEPPGYQLHLWRDGALVTHTAVFGDWPGPFRYRAPAS
jgi:3',5'-cyclic-AMP phosphodiesterase